VFGQAVAGDAANPGVYMKSVHYLVKQVAGVPLRRPAWFFDTTQQGEGLTDVGTHLVDLVMWILFPDQAIDADRDVTIVAARRWPTPLSRAAFQQVTGEDDFPAFVQAHVRGDRLDYYCNTQVDYRLRGVHVQLHVLWDLQAAPGVGDSHLAVFTGSRARIEVRQGPEENYRPELYVVPASAGQAEAVRAALARRIDALQPAYPGLTVHDRGPEWHVDIPDRFRTSHEEHFGQVTERFLGYLRNPERLPAWEKPNLLAKYAVTTQGVRRAVTVESP
jgi:predicted dehydrogenase